MKFVLIADENEKPISFFPAWEVIVFVVIVTIILVLLFPRHLFQKTLASTQPSPVSLAYLQSFQRFHPEDKGLMMNLIQQQVVLGEIDRAQDNLAILKTMGNTQGTEMQNQFRWINYLILRREAYNTESNSVERTKHMKQLRATAKELADVPLPIQELKTLAMDNLALGQAPVALKIYNHLYDRNELTTPAELAEGASIAMQNNAQQESAKFDMAAYENSLSIQDKRKYAIQAIKDLWAANLVQQALSFANELPDDVIDDHDTLLYLSRLALAANRPDVAQQYLLKALLVEKK